MADNVSITAGTGTPIATDQVTGTGEHVQIVKLAYATDGSRSVIPADVDGLLVKLATVPSHAVTNTPVKPSSATVTSTTGDNTAKTIAATNAARAHLSVQNISGATVYLKWGTAASSASHTVKMIDGAFYELPQPVYTGIVTALWASGSLLVTES